MFKALGNTFQGINSIAEGARKKRDGKKLIALSEARARNAEQMDYTNNSAQIKVSGRANESALENINLGATQAFEQASDAGIRGIGMIGKIQQNVNDATTAQENRLADREFAVQQMKAQEQSSLQQQKNQEIGVQENRTDQMQERGQSLRSQGSSEVGQGASQTGGAVDNLGQEIFPQSKIFGKVGELKEKVENVKTTPSGATPIPTAAPVLPSVNRQQQPELGMLAQRRRFNPRY